MIPPPVEPGEAPITISTMTVRSPALEKDPSGNVENPAVLADTLVKKAPIQVISSVSFKSTVPAAVSTRLINSTTLACMESFFHRNRFAMTSRITKKPMPPKITRAQVTRFKSISSWYGIRF